jgi:hypothetical protein
MDAAPGRHLHVHEDEIGAVLFEDRRHIDGIRRVYVLMADAAEEASQEDSEFFIVVHDQNLGHHGLLERALALI